MRAKPLPAVADLVLLGGGHAHALLLHARAMRPQPGVRITLVSPDPVAPYTGMLPGLIAGHYRRDEVMIDLVRLATRAGARVILDRADGLDPAARRLHLEGRGWIGYDLLSVDIGIGSDLPGVPGFADHAVAAKPLGPYAERWEAFVAAAPDAPCVTVVGAGLGGVELALASAHRLAATGRTGAQVTLVDAAPEILGAVGPGTRRRLLGALARAGVVLRPGAAPAGFGPGHVTLAGGEVLASDFTVTAAGARAQSWLAGTGLAQRDGFVTVDRFLRSSDPAVFAAGDCADLAESPRPRAGVYAVRAAPVLDANLRATLAGTPLRPFRPQSDYLKLVSMGGQRAAVDRQLAGLPLSAEGAWAWAWKDRIDRAFMARFAPGPRPARPEAPHGAARGLAELLAKRPRCAGCGGKVGPEALAAALALLPAPARPDVLAGAGDDAAVLAVDGGGGTDRGMRGVQVLTTDQLTALWPEPGLMVRLAAVHALGDVWAMGAAPQAALAQVGLPEAAAAAQARDLAAIIAAAAEVLRAAGADLAGGHTAGAADLTLGFAVTGLAPRAPVRGGMRPGDALILTKPLGTGTIFAALMADAPAPPGLILGEAVAAALAVMARPLAAEAAILAPLAHAMTDVTGFGLAGHLLGLCRAAGCGAELHLGDLPLLPGAEALAAAGESSSLAAANRDACAGALTAPPGPRGDLLHDPQTCGGLLAAVPPDRAEDVLAALRVAGVPAARIGRAIAGTPAIRAGA